MLTYLMSRCVPYMFYIVESFKSTSDLSEDGMEM